jgi:hypothetical protein
VEANELWPNALPMGMMAMGRAETNHIARYDAWSMVVHDPETGNKMLCADLKW